MNADIAKVIDFWRASEANWFVKDEGFDARFRDGFMGLHLRAAAREFDDWAVSAEGALALLILLDQFPRNSFRGTGHMYATDPLARHYARMALAANHPEAVGEPLRLFFALPFAHSEDLTDQDISVSLYHKYAAKWVEHGEGHRDIVRRFGRFPHRNHILARDTTPEEAAFLAEGGFSG